MDRTDESGRGVTAVAAAKSSDAGRRRRFGSGGSRLRGRRRRARGGAAWSGSCGGGVGGGRRRRGRRLQLPAAVRCGDGGAMRGGERGRRSAAFKAGKERRCLARGAGAELRTPARSRRRRQGVRAADSRTGGRWERSGELGWASARSWAGPVTAGRFSF